MTKQTYKGQVFRRGDRVVCDQGTKAKDTPAHATVARTVKGGAFVDIAFDDGFEGRVHASRLFYKGRGTA